MRSTLFRAVLQKEVLDLLRDKRTWISALLIPIIVIPVMTLLVGSQISRINEEAKSYVPFAAASGTDPQVIREVLQIPGAVQLDPADPLAAVKKGEIRVYLKAPSVPGQNLAQGGQLPVEIWYDPTNQKSEYADNAIKEALRTYADKIVAERLEAAGLTSQLLKPLVFESKSVASEQEVAGSTVASIIPLILLLSLASGGIAAAVDLMAGEKERGTLESLIAAPVPASHLLTAKLLAIMMMSLLGAFATIGSLGLLFSFILPEAKGALSLSILSPTAVLVLVAMILLLSAMFAGVELALSTLARSNKEAQTYMTPIVFAALVPAYMLMPLSPVDIPIGYYALPVFNGVALFKELLHGGFDTVHTLLALTTSVGYVALAVWLASRMFRNERFYLR